MALRRIRYDEEFKKSLAALFRAGRDVNSISAEYGVTRATLADWISRYGGDVPAAKGGCREATPEMKNRRSVIEAELKTLLEAGGGLVSGTRERLEAVRALSYRFDIDDLCRVLRVMRSDYDKAFSEQLSKRAAENRTIKGVIRRILSSLAKKPSAYVITRVLKEDYGVTISVGRTRRLMAAMDRSDDPKTPEAERTAS